MPVVSIQPPGRWEGEAPLLRAIFDVDHFPPNTQPGDLGPNPASNPGQITATGAAMPDDRSPALILYIFASVAGVSFLAAVYFVSWIHHL